MSESPGDAGVSDRSPHVLVVGGDPGVDELRERLGKRADGSVEVRTVDPEGDLDDLHAERASCLVVRADPPGDLADLLSSIRGYFPDVPIVLYGDEGTAVSAGAVSAGVADYVHDGDGAVDRLAAAVVDHALASPEPGRARDRFLSALVESSSDVLAILDRDGVIDYMSPAVEGVLGWSPEAMEGDLAAEYVHPDDYGTVAEFFGDPTEWVGERRKATYRFRDADGDWRTVESIARSRLDDPVVEGVVVNSRDVTEREQRKAELELYETIVETVPVGLFVIDEESRIDLINQEGVDTVDEMARDELIGYRILDMIRDGYFNTEMAEKYVDGVRDMLSSDTDADRFIEDVHYYPPDGGDTRYFNVHWALRPLEDGEFRGTVVAFQDITERKIYEQELERKNERLEQFASFVSHDLRNPLNVAQGFAVQARETGDVEAIEEVEVSLDRMEQLIEELLTLAREGGGVEELERVDLAAAAREAWRTVETGDATLEVLDDVVVEADASLLRQLLENLFRNAVEHGSTSSQQSVGDPVEHGSTISQPSADDAVEQGPDDGGGVVVTVGGREGGFFVEDDGVGIPEDRRDEVLDIGYTTSDEGTGFGLGIVRRVAEIHGWSVDVTESGSGGARFEFGVPDRGG